VVHADLHTHTHCSDGQLSPAALVDRAVSKGIQVLSVTDHDTTAGLAGAARAAADRPIAVVPGAELSVTVDGHEVHLLGYGFDPSHPSLQDHLQRFADARTERMQAMIARLQERGVSVAMEDVGREARRAQSLGRPHLAQALVTGGHVDTVQEAFDEYLAAGRPAHVEKPPVPAEKVLTLLHDAGGIGVLAHPAHWTPSARLRALVDRGLDGIEVVHPSHDASLQSYYERWARGRDLLRTGGSDFHGHRERDAEALGRVGLDGDQWDALRSRLVEETAWGRTAGATAG
jgi:hypothetical protein